MDITILLSVIVVIASVLFYRYNMKNKHFWKDRHIPFLPQKFLLGSFDILQITSKRQHLIDDENYKKYGKIFGGFEGSRPVLFVSDPEQIKNICIKDFATFPLRRVFPYQDELLHSMVAAASGDKWRRLRVSMTPAFSSGKMRVMSKLIDECAKTASINLKVACSEESMDMKKIFGAFTMDSIASTVFGTKIDSHNDANNTFVKFASKTFDKGFNVKTLLGFLFPSLGKILGFRFLPLEVEEFFGEATHRIIKQRNNNKQDVKRVDFVQLMLEANKLEDPSKTISDIEILANCMLFFIAGYDSTAAALSCILYNLARYEKHQDRLAKEISVVLKETNGELDYDIIKRMPFLDAVFNENLRLFPPATRIERESIEDYTFEDLSFSIPKGSLIGFPVYSIHRDPKYFPDPETFNPERFLPENRQLMDSNAYMPFGIGPRSCLAMRFAHLEVKMCLARILPQFRFTVTKQTKIPPDFYTAFEVFTPKDMFLKVSLRK